MDLEVTTDKYPPISSQTPQKSLTLECTFETSLKYFNTVKGSSDVVVIRTLRNVKVVITDYDKNRLIKVLRANYMK